MNEKDQKDYDEYLETIKEYKLLTDKKAAALISLVKKGNVEARDLLIKRSLKRVVYVAKIFVNRGLPLIDLIGEGNVALIEALDEFDVEKTFYFNKFIYYRIRNGIVDALAKTSKTIAIPRIIEYDIHIIDKVTEDWLIEKGCLPSDLEIAKISGMTLDRLNKAKLASYRREVDSLNRYKNGEEINVALDYATEDEIRIVGLKEAVSRAFESLSLKEEEILSLRFGFDGKGEKNQAEVSRILNCRRQNISSFEAKALRKVRHPYRSKFLKEYY